MNRTNLISLLILITAMVSISCAVVLRIGINKREKIIFLQRQEIENIGKSLFSLSSLEWAVNYFDLYDEEYRDGIKRTVGLNNYLVLTEEVLSIFQQNGLGIVKYKIEGEDDKEIIVSSEGSIKAVMKLLYDLTFPEGRYRIDSIKIDSEDFGASGLLVLGMKYE